MDGPRVPRLTPWVGRLLAANAIVALLVTTVFMAPRFTDVLRFDPGALLERPWTLLSYAFVHGGLLHLALTSLALLVFGPPVERKLGGRRFAAFYVYCAVGAALFAFGFSTVLDVRPFVGASGAIYGVMLGFVMFWPDAEMTVPPLPVPVTSRTLFGFLLTVDAFGALVAGTVGSSLGIAHLAHLGGAGAGYAFFRFRALTADRPTPPPPTSPPARRPVVTPMRVQETVTELSPSPTVVDPGPPELNDAEVDRVLDKISQHGLASLTNEERQFLAEVSKRKRDERL